MDQYLKSAILTAGPAKLIEMIYDQIIELIQKAIVNIENNEKRNNILLRAQEMIIYLMSILDDQKGGQIAKNLRELYDFVYRELVEGNIHKDTKKLEEAMEIMKELLETWKEVEKKTAQKSNANFELSV